MHILAMANASTFIAHRKYFRFWRVFLLKNQGNGELCILTQVSQALPHTGNRWFRACGVYVRKFNFDKASSQSRVKLRNV